MSFGDDALDFLMTYGWAILIGIMVIGAYFWTLNLTLSGDREVCRNLEYKGQVFPELEKDKDFVRRYTGLFDLEYLGSEPYNESEVSYLNASDGKTYSVTMCRTTFYGCLQKGDRKDLSLAGTRVQSSFSGALCLAVDYLDWYDERQVREWMDSLEKDEDAVATPIRWINESGNYTGGQSA